MQINNQIQKLQGGGFANYSAALSPYVPTSLGQSVPETDEGDSNSSKKSSGTSTSDKDTTRDEILRALMDSGLPNEANEIINKMSNILSSSYFDSLPNSQKQSYYLQVIGDVNSLKFNKEQYSDAIKQAQENGGLNDLAITEYGRMIVQDQDGNLKQMTPEVFSKNSDKYIPVTNSYLANLRARVPDLAFDTNVIGVIKNGIGPEKINQFITNIIDRAQTNENTVNKVVGSQQASEVVQGLQQLQNGLIKEGYSDKNNYKQVEAAVDYLYKMMPSQYKQYLEAKAVSEGRPINSGVFDLIKGYAQVKLSRDISQTESATKDSASGSNTPGSSNTKGITTQAMSGYLGGDQIDLKFNFGDSTTFTLGANRVYSNMERYKTLQDVMDNKEWGGSLDPHHVYFGSEHVDSVDTNKILYNGGNFHLTYLPIDDKGNPAFGVLKALARVNKGQNAQEYVNHQFNYNNDLNMVNQYFDESNGKFTPKNQSNLFGRYWIMNGLASTKDGVLTDPEESDLKPTKLTNSDILKNAQVQFRTSTAQKSPDGKSTSFYNPSDIYSGIIFIKDNGSYISSAVNSNKLVGGEYNKIAPQEDVDRRYNANNSFNQLQQPVNTSSTNLGI